MPLWKNAGDEIYAMYVHSIIYFQRIRTRKTSRKLSTSRTHVMCVMAFTQWLRGMGRMANHLSKPQKPPDSSSARVLSA